MQLYWLVFVVQLVFAVQAAEQASVQTAVLVRPEAEIGLPLAIVAGLLSVGVTDHGLRPLAGFEQSAQPYFVVDVIADLLLCLAAVIVWLAVLLVGWSEPLRVAPFLFGQFFAGAVVRGVTYSVVVVEPVFLIVV